ncbi:MAG: TolC family protein [Bdellovibrionota bacterium]
MRINKLIKIQLMMLGFASVSFAQQKINLDTYLEQVKKNNPAFKATQDASEGAKLRATEGTLLILPQLEVVAQKSVDQTEGTNPSASGTKSTNEAYSVSLLQNTPIGLKGKLSYSQNYYLIENAALSYPAPYDDGFYRTGPSIELTQSLWKNFFGSEVRAQRTQINAAAQAAQYMERAKNLGVIIEAQNTYHNLYFTKKTVAAFKESMGVAEKLRGWSKKRLDQGLGESSDYYQTKAAYELRELEYLNALDAEKAAARAFNSLKGENSETVTELLDAPTLPVFNKKNFSEQTWSDEVRAASKQAEAAKATSLLGKERNRPTLDLYGKYAWTGLDVDKDEAKDESMADNHPVYSVGVKFVMPLAFGKSSDVIEGYKLEAQAADLAFRRKAQEQERDYNNLIAKIENANLRLKLVSTLEESQRIKSQTERKRHDRGRTTFFQVLQFEQDYLTAQLTKIKTEAELNTLLTQLQQYRGE